MKLIFWKEKEMNEESFLFCIIFFMKDKKLD